MTPAQWFCLLAGLGLLLGGLLGFISDSTFDTTSSVDTDRGGNADGALQGDGFLGFEVNGWHNLFHAATGLLLLLAFRRRGPARTLAIGVGLLYAVITIIGLVDGNDVLGFIPVNPADNLLHAALAALGLLTGFMSRGDDDRPHRRGAVRPPRPATRAPDPGITARRSGARDGHGDGRPDPGRVVAPAPGTTPESRKTDRRRDTGELR